MAGEGTGSVDFWEILEEAEETVERWPWWQQRYAAGLHYEEELVIPDLWEPSAWP